LAIRASVVNSRSGGAALRERFIAPSNHESFSPPPWVVACANSGERFMLPDAFSVAAM
jgi:hypothetical protein